ncbi:MAG TPA: response regulator [Phycisphaerae bacterium]|nr:response regulator [Phycisphaerae bacterium]HRY71346.1 response regulator [Phycisphaerae bacterium]HSA29800.1 response regulator [Phycisphaerae bacterium]
MTTPNIMIVDDDTSFVEAVTTFLRAHGYQVTKALTGRQGVDEARRQQVDLAVIDVYLPDVGGAVVARAMRHSHPTVPLIMISSDDSPETVRKCIQAGACTFLPKPLIPREFLSCISKWVDRGVATQ